ncbi:glycosyltransferase family 32 protein [Butyrivibrio sp. FCS006]|uniref:glycosyltransferase family 32 protein n=1 Tax=Butyrivibrio sp. FCS006 TaxID=1280684 RepID=UPI00041A7D88|nr:glycosyltransferase [Butyrivibrio sp. FCS006]
MNKIERYFEKLKTKDIICWGNGKHYRNITYPFLQKSGLIENLKGFADASDKDKLAQMDRNKTVILIAVTGYDEILGQLKADERLSGFEAVPSIYLESLYEDMLLLSVNKPPLNYRKEEKPVIPKLIHAIWFSGDPMPELYLRCLESWKKYAPDYEIKIWNMETYKPDRCLFFEQAIEHKNWAFASDYARADLLYRYGGIYMDLDVEMLRPIDDLLYNDAYMSFESLDRIECGSGMGSRPGHPIIKEICESYEKRPYLKEDGTWDNSTCPVRYTQVIEKHGLKKDGGFQFVEDITVYPFEVLTGKSFDTGIIYSSDLSYTVHHHNGSWIPDPAHKAMNERYNKIQRFLESLE